MAIFTIRKAGDVVLKEICKPVDRVDRKIKFLLDNMTETMYKANGVGLAAPQVGETVRVVVIDIGDGLLEMVNPVIVKQEGCFLDTEGCLSIPEYFGEVERFEKVTVEFLNRRGKVQSVTAEGLLSRAIQHEVDHLDGVLFIEKAKSLYRGKSK